MSFKNYCYHCLHNPRTNVAKVINTFISLLIIFSVAAIPLHFIPDLEWFEPTLITFEKFTATVFTIEFIFRAYSSHKPLKYTFSWYGIVDLLAIVPFYLAQMGLVARPEIFFFLRMLRILKLAKLQNDYLHQSDTIKNLKTHGHFKLLEGEHLQDIVQKHPIVFVLGLLLPITFMSIGLSILIFFEMHVVALGFSSLFFLMAVVFFIKIWIDYVFDVIYVTDQRIMIQDRELFSTISNDISYESITNIMPKQYGLMRWMFQYGDIEIQTADQKSPRFKSAPKPDSIVHTITENRQRIMHKRIKSGGGISPNQG